MHDFLVTSSLTDPKVTNMSGMLPKNVAHWCSTDWANSNINTVALCYRTVYNEYCLYISKPIVMKIFST